MHRKSLLALFIVSVVFGCRKNDSNTPTPAPGGGLTQTIDLTPHGIPGLIDVPLGSGITKQDESQVAIDHEDEPFDLRILPYKPIDGTLQEHRKSLDESGPYEMLVDEKKGFLGFHRNPAEFQNHKVELYLEVMLGDRKFVVRGYASDNRVTKELAERMWRTARSLRPK